MQKVYSSKRAAENVQLTLILEKYCFLITMSPFEAHILIQQASTITISPFAADSSLPNNGSINGSSSSSIEATLHQALQSHRLNPNLRFKTETFLSTCIKKGCSNLLKLFLEHGADPNLKSYENGRYEPALITAVRYKSLRCVQILLQYGANLSKTNFYGTDAIFQAVHENAFEILDCLLCHERSEQPQQKDDVPKAAAISSSSSTSSLQQRTATAAPPPHLQSIIIQKTTTTMKGKDSKGNGNKAVTPAAAAGVKVVLNREKPPNNTNSIKGHDDPDDDHLLCPFYYALNYALTYPSKRASFALLLQSYYKCKCLQEIANCCCSRLKHINSSIEDDQVKECLRAVQLLTLRNFSSSCKTTREDKSVPVAGGSIVHADDDDGVRQQEYYYYSTHHHHVDNESDIRFQRERTAGESGGGGGERNEFPSSNLFPYKVYKIQGKCHVIKENESSSSTSSPPSPTAAEQRASSSYVVLVGPLKLSCITREVIRDQIMRSTQTTCTSTAPSSTNGSALSRSSTTTVAPNHNHHEKLSLQSKSGEAHQWENEYIRKKESWRKGNFRKSLETLMMPSSLMDYILYRNIQWNYDESRGNSSKRKSEREKKYENNELVSANIDNIRLMNRDPELNINYFAICIY